MPIILSLCLVFLSPAASPATNYRGNLFLEMMLTMMKIMGFIDRDDDYYDQPYPNFNQFPYIQPYAGNNPMLPGSGWTGTMPPQGLAGSQYGVPYLPQYFNQYRSGRRYKPHWIEGRWAASDGMIMEVSQGEFKMYYRDAPKQVRGGLIRLKDHWLAIYEKTQQISRQYEFAFEDDRLALRDADGNLMLFMRLQDWPITLR